MSACRGRKLGMWGCCTGCDHACPGLQRQPQNIVLAAAHEPRVADLLSCGCSEVMFRGGKECGPYRKQGFTLYTSERKSYEALAQGTRWEVYLRSCGGPGHFQSSMLSQGVTLKKF